MISGLVGTIVAIQHLHVELQVAGGVIYELSWCSRDIETLIPGREIRVLTSLVIREDQWTLYGFSQAADRLFFKALMRVTGIGPKLAQSVVGSVDPWTFSQWILQKDHRSIARLPGLGKKTAERLVMELHDKMVWLEAGESPGCGAGGMAPPPAAGSAAPVNHRQDPQWWEDTLAALVTLGYTPEAARRALSRVEERMPSPETLLKAALQQCTIREASTAW